MVKNIKNFFLIGLLSILGFVGVIEAADTSQALPRFVSLGSKRVYMRVGPGKMFSVSWEVRQEGMPVEIILESDSWRKIRDHEGTEGWVHKSMLSSARSVIFLKGLHAFLKSPEDQAKVLAHVEEGVIGRLLSYTKDWAQVKIGKTKGWVRRESVWGLYPQEVKSPSKCWIPFLCLKEATK